MSARASTTRSGGGAATSLVGQATSARAHAAARSTRGRPRGRGASTSRSYTTPARPLSRPLGGADASAGADVEAPRRGAAASIERRGASCVCPTARGVVAARSSADVRGCPCGAEQETCLENHGSMGDGDLMRRFPTSRLLTLPLALVALALACGDSDDVTTGTGTDADTTAGSETTETTSPTSDATSPTTSDATSPTTSDTTSPTTSDATSSDSDTDTTAGSESESDSETMNVTDSDTTEPCVSPEIECDGACVDPSDDDDNCGDCGIVCGVDESCQAGQCTLDCGDLEDCDGACVDPNTDPLHCGGCGVE
ncbi:MAG: hypothetical protein KC636_39080, partial [Myxococcales bacterium]|nr:hypothetical protein [Myxococcales bacterium]